MARTASLPQFQKTKYHQIPNQFLIQQGNSTKKMNSKEANSKAQSSFDSQKTRATACSKEAELKADLLIELYPQFEFKVEEFPEKVRKHNQGIFNDWKGLFRQMYRLDAITKKSTESTASKSIEHDLPAPSEFAQPSVWPNYSHPLRPPNARGLPLTTLHHVFHQFHHKSSRPLPTTTETVAVRIAASKLCLRMGEARMKQNVGKLSLMAFSRSEMQISTPSDLTVWQDRPVYSRS